MATARSGACDRIIASADIFLPDGSYLHLEQDNPAELGWWRVRGRARERLTVSAAFVAAPRALRHEVILEPERLIEEVCLHGDALLFDAPEWRVALTRLHESICVARAGLRGEERPRDLGHTLPDRMRG